MSTQQAFATHFEPVARIGENLLVLPKEKYGYYKVTAIEPIPIIIKDFGAINAESESKDTAITEVELNEDEIGQFRFIPLDDIEVEIKQPLANARGFTKTVVTRVSKLSAQLDPTLKHTEVFTIEDEKLYFKIKNPSKSNISRSRVAIFGWKFKVKELKAKPQKYAVIQVEVLPTGGGVE